MEIFAAFLLIPGETPWQICATTRPDGRVGLPGGKVDPGETAREAALRETAEEGWIIDPERVSVGPVHTQEVDGKICAWFRCYGPGKIATEFKEKGRIVPFIANVGTLSDMGNPQAIRASKICRIVGVTHGMKTL